MAISFFTDPTSISNPQSSTDAYGPQPIDNGNETFNLSSAFTLNTGTVAYAIFKSLIIFLEDKNNANILNVAILPIPGANPTGFPIKFIIYRGLARNAILDGSNKVKLSDSSWASDNILEVIKTNQDKINQKEGTSITADSNVLGLQFNSKPDETFLEALLFDETDDFNPLIINAGCQIGKFIGGSTNGNIEVILDVVGREGTTGLLKSNDHQFTIPELDTTGLNDDETAIEVFKNRNEKSFILGNMPIAGVYGSCINQNIKINGLVDAIQALANFHNNNKVFLDIRNDFGFSYAHFFDQDENVSFGLKSNASDPANYTVKNYYTNWPILILDNEQYPSSDHNFYLKLPITEPGGLPVILSSYTKGVTINDSSVFQKFFQLGARKVNGTVKSSANQEIKFKNWIFDTSTLGCNYFLLKVDRIRNSPNVTGERILDNYFNLSIKYLFDQQTMDDGEFGIKTYSSLNAPLQVNKAKSEIYRAALGIALDKAMITFFTFKEETAIELLKGQKKLNIPLFRTGKYKLGFDPTNLNYQNPDQFVGFLYQISKKARFQQYRLTKRIFNESMDTNFGKEFISYQRENNLNPHQADIIDFHSISISLTEYNEIINHIANTTSNDLIIAHDAFLLVYNQLSSSYSLVDYMELKIDVSFPSLIKVDSQRSFVLKKTDNDIWINGQPLTVNAIKKN